jgi:CMP-N-acetylneuraminic acid synthetase
MHSQPQLSWTAIVPLRAGSKGLPGKNLRLLGGIPLFEHSVRQAQSAGATRIIITTDLQREELAPLSPEVELISRPKELAEDTTPMAPVILNAIDTAQIKGLTVLLQPTSPLRSERDIRQGLELKKASLYDLVLSTVEADRSVLKWGTMAGDRFIPLAAPDYCFSNRQSLPPVFRPNGAVYVFEAQWFTQNRSFSSNNIGCFSMPLERSHDIDSLADFEAAERYLNQSKLTNVTD